MTIQARSNDAILVNPPFPAVIHLTRHGSNWLWTMVAILIMCNFGMLVWHWSVPRGQRLFHQMSIIILTTSTIAYFSMASDLGFAAIATEFGYYAPAGLLRQVWYVRYIDWVITAPLLLLVAVLPTGLPLSDIVTVCFFGIVMFVMRLTGGLVESSYKWGFYAFSLAALFYIMYVLLGPSRLSARSLGPDYKSTATMSGVYLSCFFCLYPVCWALAEGANIISTDSEMVWYGILDLWTKPIFLYIQLFSISSLDLAALQLSSSKYSVGVLPPSNANQNITADAMMSTVNSGTSGGGLRKSLVRRGHHDDTSPAARYTVPQQEGAYIAPQGEGGYAPPPPNAPGGPNMMGEVESPTSQPRLSQATAVAV